MIRSTIISTRNLALTHQSNVEEATATEPRAKNGHQVSWFFMLPTEIQVRMIQWMPQATRDSFKLTCFAAAQSYWFALRKCVIIDLHKDTAGALMQRSIAYEFESTLFRLSFEYDSVYIYTELNLAFAPLGDRGITFWRYPNLEHIGNDSTDLAQFQSFDIKVRSHDHIPQLIEFMKCHRETGKIRGIDLSSIRYSSFKKAQIDPLLAELRLHPDLQSLALGNVYDALTLEGFPNLRSLSLKYIEGDITIKSLPNLQSFSFTDFDRSGYLTLRESLRGLLPETLRNNRRITVDTRK